MLSSSKMPRIIVRWQTSERRRPPPGGPPATRAERPPPGHSAQRVATARVASTSAKSRSFRRLKMATTMPTSTIESMMSNSSRPTRDPWAIGCTDAMSTSEINSARCRWRRNFFLSEVICRSLKSCRGRGPPEPRCREIAVYASRRFYLIRPRRPEPKLELVRKALRSFPLPVAPFAGQTCGGNTAQRRSLFGHGTIGCPHPA